ncbi:MAG: NAD(P)/FAD-dependent oxidoreductase, partial [Gemmobacter sp.]|nr:NAD(P)/FAD-dependent oxidoreductase [Gemmobacter sp.]
HEKTLGQLFCDGPAVQIVDMLRRDMALAGVTLWLETATGAVQREGQGFRIETARGPVVTESVVIATGGKAIPTMGATGYGYQAAESFGLKVEQTRPGLVPLTLAAQVLAETAPLSGTSVTGTARLGRTGFDEAILYTHRGLSGPAILQISSYWREGDSVTLDLARGAGAGAQLRAMRSGGGRIAIRTALARIVPEKLARPLEERSGLGGNLADQPNAALDRLAALVHEHVLTPVGSEGYRTAEVTLGGVSTDMLDARTMQARAVDGLYFVGEVVDVTGWLGGYNFQWAWSSGWAAGQVI